jgi:hypothetical protein
MSPLLTVAEVADRFGCRRRPTWRISQDAVIDLERRRASGLPQADARPHRRSPPANVREFF